MKRFGVFVAIFGLAALVAGVLLLGSVAYRAASANEAHRLAIEPGRDLEADLKVDANRLCSVSVHAIVHSTSVFTSTAPQTAGRRRSEARQTTHTAQYEFPLRYQVFDARGRLIVDRTDAIAWNSYHWRSGGSNIEGGAGGVVEVTHHFSKFKVDEPGEIRLEASIAPDTKYNATLQSANLIVYDNVSDHTTSLFGGIGLACSSFFFVLIGVALVIVGAVRKSPLTTTTAAALGSGGEGRIEFPKVWHRSSEAQFGRFWEHRDIGSLAISGNLIVFRGRRGMLEIKSPARATLGKQGADFMSDWVRVDFPTASGMATAWFADAGWLGWRGVLGGTSRIFAAIQVASRSGRVPRP